MLLLFKMDDLFTEFFEIGRRQIEILTLEVHVK